MKNFNEAETVKIITATSIMLKDKYRLSDVTKLFLDLSRQNTGEDYRYMVLPKIMLGDCEKFNQGQVCNSNGLMCPTLKIDPDQICLVKRAGATKHHSYFDS